MQLRNRFIKLNIVVLSILCLSSTALAETVYVQAKSATIRSGTTSLSQVMATVPYGQALELIENGESWYKVRSQNGAVGWIYHTKVSSSKPSGQESSLAALGKDFRRSESSSVTGTAGVRGLDEYSAGYAKRSGIAARHRTAVDRMTNYRLTDREVEAFLESGKLGEYAE